MKNYEKHKAIAIPVSFSDDKPNRFLTVRDRRYCEWTFVTGGCRKSEISNPLKCALRELEEETRGTVNIKSGYYRYFSFNYTPDNPITNKKNEEITYHVYILEYNVPYVEQFKLVHRFNLAKSNLDRLKKMNRPIRIVYDENDSMSFETLKDFNSKGEKVWDLIRNNILENPKFYNALNTSERKFFNISNNIKR
jgi:8-oxo-dGTP pyrophosphatase MutT (NUDIX family)